MVLLFQDVRTATLSSMRKPAAPLQAVLVLSLGIGANAAIFSLVDAVLLRARPWTGRTGLCACSRLRPPQVLTTGGCRSRSSKTAAPPHRPSRVLSRGLIDCLEGRR